MGTLDYTGAWLGIFCFIIFTHISGGYHPLEKNFISQTVFLVMWKRLPINNVPPNLLLILPLLTVDLPGSYNSQWKTKQE